MSNKVTLDQNEIDAWLARPTVTLTDKIYVKKLTGWVSTANDAIDTLSKGSSAAQNAEEALKTENTELAVNHRKWQAEVTAQLQKLSEAIDKVRAAAKDKLAADIASYVGDSIDPEAAAMAAVEYEEAAKAIANIQKTIGDELPTVKAISLPSVAKLTGTAKSGSRANADGTKGWRPRFASGSVDGQEIADFTLSKAASHLKVPAATQMFASRLRDVAGGEELKPGATYSFTVTVNDVVHTVNVTAQEKVKAA